MAEEISSTPPRNEPIHTDGRVTENSMQRRMEEKLFPTKPKAEPQAEAPPQSEAPSEPSAKPEEHYEFEFDGEKFQVPSKLKPMYETWEKKESLEKDYTAKTTRASDVLKSVELQQHQMQQQQALHKALEPKYKALSALDQQIQQYESLDWRALVANNAQEALAHNLTYQQLKSQRDKAKEELAHEAQGLLRGIDETRAKLKSEHLKILQRDVKGWNEQRAEKVFKFAEENYGFTPDETKTVIDSRVVKMMNDAFELHELRASKPQAVATPTKTLRPSAAERQSAQTAAEAAIKKDIRSAKPGAEKERHLQRLLASRL